MKHISLISFSVLMFCTSFIGPAKPTAPSTELHDIQAIQYAIAKTRNGHNLALLMDLFYPTGASSDKKYPLIIFCHAGGFTGGNRSNVSAIADEFADQGFIVAAIEYRTGYKSGNRNACEADTAGMMDAHYRAVQDVKACFRFLVANANLYNVDTTALFVGGSSAGAGLALESSYLTDSIAQIVFPGSYLRLGSVDGSGNKLTNKYKVKGIVNLWGGIIQGDRMISPSYPSYPTIMFKGDEDADLPDSVGHYANCDNYPIIYAGSAIYTLLQNCNTPVVFHFLPGAGHPAYDDQFCVQQSACFLKAVIAGTPYGGRYQYYVESCH